jgi:hypothetical protein
VPSYDPAPYPGTPHILVDHQGVITNHHGDPPPEYGEPVDGGSNLAWRSYRDMENALYDGFMHRQRQQEAAQPPRDPDALGPYSDDAAPINAARYALLPTASLRPFTEAHWGGDGAAQHVLADRLEEADDPRGRILLRHLGHTQHPMHDLYRAAGGGFAPRNAATGEQIPSVTVESGDMRTPEGFSSLKFHPSTVTDGDGNEHRSVYASHWLTRRHPDYDAMMDAGIHGYQDFRHAGNFDESEARWMAEQLPEPHRTALHAMLDQTFPKAETPPTTEEPEQYAWFGVGRRDARVPPPADLTARIPRRPLPTVRL